MVSTIKERKSSGFKKNKVPAILTDMDGVILQGT
jgi:hypothetical protein